MQRECTRCRRSFTPPDLARAESKNLEAERKAAGLVGVRFLYYTCPACQTADIFVDILPVAGEPSEAFGQRRDEMESVVRRLHAQGGDGTVEAVVMEVRADRV
jgi:hypothetical protein